MRILPVVVAVVAPAVGACALPPSTATWVTPLDGQTAVPVDQDLVVFVPALDAPPDHELPPELFTVVDLDRGGRVAGSVTYRGGSLTFRPRGGWADDTRYAWSLQALPDRARRPSMALPAHLVGDATFSTGGEAHLLAAAHDAAGAAEPRPCLVFSRRLLPSEVGALHLTVDDQQVALTEILHAGEDAFHALPRRPVDHGVDVLCLESLTLDPAEPGPDSGGGGGEGLSAGVGQSLRVWLGDLGPWRVTLTADSVADHLVALRRERR